MTTRAEAALEHGFRWPVRIYYEDTDAGGVVYYANYLKFFERARTEWLRACGHDQAELARARNLLFVVRSIEVQYRRPAKLDDRLEITVRTLALHRASIECEQMALAADGAECARGRVGLACVAAQTLRPTPLPPDLQEIFR